MISDSNSCFEVSLWEVQSGSRRELQKLQVLELFFAESRCAFTEHVHVLRFSLNLGQQERENAKLKLVEFVVQSSSHILANLRKPHCFAHWCSLSLPFNRFIGSNSTEGAGTPFEWCPSQRHHNCYRKSSWTITATGSPGYQWVLWVASCMWIPCHSFDSLVEHHLHHQGRWDSSNEWLAVCNLPAVQLRFGILQQLLFWLVRELAEDLNVLPALQPPICMSTLHKKERNIQDMCSLFVHFLGFDHSIPFSVVVAFHGISTTFWRWNPLASTIRKG